MDVGPEMTAKIVKDNSQVLHRSTYKALDQNEWKQEECRDECRSFIELFHQSLGSWAMVDNLADLGTDNTSQYNPMRRKHKMYRHFK